MLYWSSKRGACHGSEKAVHGKAEKNERHEDDQGDHGRPPLWKVHPAFDVP